MIAIDWQRSALQKAAGEMPNRAKLVSVIADDWVTAGPVIMLESLSGKAGIAWSQILARARLDSRMLDAPESKLPIQTVLALFEDFGSRCSQPDVIFDAFYQMPKGHAGSFDYLALFAPTIRQALTNWSAFYPIRSNCIRLTYQETEQNGILTWDLPDRFGPRSFYSTTFFAYLIGRLERMLGDGKPAPVKIEFSSVPLRTTPAFLRPYSQRIKFNCQTSRLLVSSSVLDLVPTSAEANLYAIIESAALRTLAEATAHQSIVSSIAVAISAEMQKGDCSIRAVAQSMGMSERSLQRTLESEGTTFRKLLDDVRKHSAQTYLMETDLPVGEISQLLGFSDISAFSRAVKQWYGVSPKGLRLEGPAQQASASMRKTAGRS
ncbi:helix-turn-helix domain-containing protein [Roseibium litorale]